MAKGIARNGAKEGLKAWLSQAVQNALDVGPVALEPKWAQREAVYQCDKKYAGARLFDNVEPYAYDVLGPVMRRVRDDLMAALTATQTWCQAIPLGETTQDAADVLEQGVQRILDSAGAERSLYKAVLDMVLLNPGFVRIRMDRKGLLFDRIHPSNMAVAASVGETLDDCGLVGHRFYEPYWKFCQMVEEGLFPMIGDGTSDLLKFIGRGAVDDQAGVDTARNPASQNVDTSDSDFTDVRLFELICRVQFTDDDPVAGEDDDDFYKFEPETDPEYDDEEPAVEKYDVEDSPTGLYRIVWSDECSEVLVCEPFHYDRSGYFDLRLHDEEPFWSVESVGSRILPQCIHQSQLLNLLVVTAMLAAARPSFLAGGAGVLGKKINTIKMGQLLPVTAETKLLPWPFDGDFTGLIAAIEHNDNRINKSAGVSESSLQGEEAVGGQPETATAVSKRAEGQRKAEGAKFSFFSKTIESMFAFVLDLCRWHPSVAKSVYEGEVDERFWDATRAKVEWSATGLVPGSTGSVLVSKLGQLMQIAQVPGSPVHMGRTLTAMVNALQVADSKTLMKTKDEIEAEKQAAIAAQQNQLMAQAMGAKPEKNGQAMAPVQNGAPVAPGNG